MNVRASYTLIFHSFSTMHVHVVYCILLLCLCLFSGSMLCNAAILMFTSSQLAIVSSYLSNIVL